MKKIAEKILTAILLLSTAYTGYAGFTLGGSGGGGGTIPIATDTVTGKVKAGGVGITVDADGTLNATGEAISGTIAFASISSALRNAAALSTIGAATTAQGATADAAVPKATYNAHTVLYATTDNTPAALEVTQQTVVGRATGGNIAAIAIDSDLSSVSASDDTVPSAKATKAVTDTLITKALFGAHSVLAATSDDVPAALTITESTIVGRAPSGNIAAIGLAAGLTITEAGNLTIGTLNQSTSGTAALATALAADPADCTNQFARGVAASGAAACGSVAAADVTNNTLTAAQLAAALTFAEGDLIDLSGITMSGTNDEGLALPFWANITPTSGATKRFFTWDEEAGVMKVHAASGWVTINPSSGAPTDSPYLLIGSASASLSAERVLTEGLALDFTDAGANGALTIAFDPTELTGDRTWAAGGAGTVAWTWNLSAGDPTLTFGNDLITSSNSLTVATGKNITLGTTQWNSGDEIDGTKVKDADLGDVTVSAAGAWTIDAGVVTAAKLASADFGPFTNSAGTITVDTDVINDTHIDWGTGATQVSMDDVPDGATYQKVAAADVDAANHVNLIQDIDGTGAITTTGTTATRAKTVRDAADTILELGGSYTPTGTWNWATATATWPTPLNALAGVTPAANALPYYTSTTAATTTTMTAAGRALLDDAAASDQRTTLGLAIGTDVQAYNAALASVAGLTETTGGMPYFTASNAWAVLAAGTAGKLIRYGGSNAPTWSTLTMPDTIAAGSVFVANTADTLAAVTSASGTKFLQNVDGTISWATGVGTIAGSTGSTDNALITANGTGGSTIQANASTATLSDTGVITAAGFTATAVDGSNKITITNNTVAMAPTASSMEIYPETNVWKLNQNGTEYSVPLSAAASQLSFGAVTSGGILYGSASNTVASSGALPQYSVITGGGAGATPVALTVGTDNQVLLGHTGAASSFGSLPVAALPIVTASKGGTGVANNDLNTITFAGGNYGLTTTLAGDTNVTFPTAGTLAILGANTFTGAQTLSAASANSTVSVASFTGSPAFNANDVHRDIYLNHTLGTITGTGNTVAMVDVAALTGDAETNLYALRVGALTGTTGSSSEVEHAISLGTGWDRGISSASPVYVGDGTNGATFSIAGGLSFAGTATFSTSAAASSVPWVVGSGTAANTAEGTAYWESDTDMLTIGDGATGISLDLTAGQIYTFPAVTSTLAALAAPVFTTSIEAPFLIIGSAATAADAGGIRLPNASYIMAEADAAGTDISVIGVDSAEIVQIGASGASAVTITPATTITGVATFTANPRIYDGDSHHLTIDAADLSADATIVLGGNTNTLSVANGTASLSVKAAQAVNFTGTFTDGRYCTYTASGSVIGCDAVGAGGMATTDIDTSAELNTIVTDNVGSGALAFATATPFTTSITPNAAGASTLGTTALEWGNVYLTDSAVIYGQADQSNSLTSSSTGWTTNLDLTVGGNDLSLGAAGVKLTGGNGALTILGLGDGQDEDVKIDLNTTANSIIISSPASSASKVDFSALNLVSTGTIQAGIKISSDADGMSESEMTTAGVYGTLFVATGAGTWTLPSAAVGMSACLMDSGTAHDLILDVQAGDDIQLKGTEQANGVGITNAAGTTTGDMVCVVAISTGHWVTMGMGGTWASQ